MCNTDGCNELRRLRITKLSLVCYIGNMVFSYDTFYYLNSMPISRESELEVLGYKNIYYYVGLFYRNYDYL